MIKLACLMAMELESQGLFEKEKIPVHYTGLGKVNATLITSEVLLNHGATHILNLGTAGSHHFHKHQLIECTRFFQRDMDVQGLGFRLGETPGDKDPMILEIPKLFDDLSNGTCATGDQFIDKNEKFITSVTHFDVIDMEAYAIAKCCRRNKVPFYSFKYITDGADGGAADDWRASLPQASKELLTVARRVYDYLAKSSEVKFV